MLGVLLINCIVTNTIIITEARQYLAYFLKGGYAGKFKMLW